VKTIDEPSGEYAGSKSFSGESAVRLIAFSPPTRSRKMSSSPPSDET
jgi:hypothetical protein